jgi:hypothetical protein
MGLLRNWWHRQLATHKYPSEHALLVASTQSLAEPGEWPHNTTLVCYFSDSLALVDFEVVLGSPDTAIYQSEPPAGARWANAFWQDEELVVSLVIDRNNKRHSLIAERGEDLIHCHFNVSGEPVDNLYGNFGSIFA